MKRKLPTTISEEEFLKIDRATKKLKIKLAHRLQFYQCFRVSEVINLEKKDIDFEKGFIHIKEAKGCKDRDIPLMPELKHYLRYLPINMTRQGLYKAIKTRGKKILNKHIHPHTLRHSGASMYLNDRGIDITFIKQFLGHEKIATTSIYLHVNPIQLKRAFQNASKQTQM